MREITIGFSKSNLKCPIVSWLIMLLEKTPFSHCYVQWNMKSVGRVLTYEASFNGVRFIGPLEFQNISEKVEDYTLQISDEAFNRGLVFSVDNLGKGYGFSYLIGMLIKRMLGFIGIKIKNPFKDDTKTHPCVEIVARYLEESFKEKIFDDVEDIGLIEFYTNFKKIFNNGGSQ